MPHVFSWDGFYVVSWTCMIAGYHRCGDAKSARELFDRMPERNLVTWSTMISGYARNNCFEKAVETFEALQAEGVVANHRAPRHQIPLRHSIKQFTCRFSIPTSMIPRNHASPWHHIKPTHPLKNTPRSIYVPNRGIHMNKRVLNVKILFKSLLNGLSMCLHAHRCILKLGTCLNQKRVGDIIR